MNGLPPPEIIKALGEFDLDPCAPINRPWATAKEHYTQLDDGLSQAWGNRRVWLNPPYGRDTWRWAEKLSNHPAGGIALIFARTETEWFHKYIWQRAHSVFFFKGRLKFYRVDGTPGESAPAPSCLVSYSQRDSNDILHASLMPKTPIKGVLIDVCRPF